ncbi:MAG TPA: hypothetical protein VIH11_06130 [Gemmatimonadaceae bacterium]
MIEYDKLSEGADAEIEVTVLAVVEADDGVPIVLAKLDGGQVELWSANPYVSDAARSLLRGTHVKARITKCPSVISDRSYGGLRKSRERIRFSRLLALRPA